MSLRARLFLSLRIVLALGLLLELAGTEVWAAALSHRLPNQNAKPFADAFVRQALTLPVVFSTRSRSVSLSHGSSRGRIQEAFLAYVMERRRSIRGMAWLAALGIWFRARGFQDPEGIIPFGWALMAGNSFGDGSDSDSEEDPNRGSENYPPSERDSRVWIAQFNLAMAGLDRVPAKYTDTQEGSGQLRDVVITAISVDIVDEKEYGVLDKLIHAEINRNHEGSDYATLTLYISRGHLTNLQQVQNSLYYLSKLMLRGTLTSQRTVVHLQFNDYDHARLEQALEAFRPPDLVSIQSLKFDPGVPERNALKVPEPLFAVQQVLSDIRGPLFGIFLPSENTSDLNRVEAVAVGFASELSETPESFLFQRVRDSSPNGFDTIMIIVSEHLREDPSKFLSVIRRALSTLIQLHLLSSPRSVETRHSRDQLVTALNRMDALNALYGDSPYESAAPSEQFRRRVAAAMVRSGFVVPKNFPLASPRFFTLRTQVEVLKKGHRLHEDLPFLLNERYSNLQVSIVDSQRPQIVVRNILRGLNELIAWTNPRGEPHPWRRLARAMKRKLKALALNPDPFSEILQTPPPSKDRADKTDPIAEPPIEHFIRTLESILTSILGSWIPAQGRFSIGQNDEIIFSVGMVDVKISHHLKSRRAEVALELKGDPTALYPNEKPQRLHISIDRAEPHEWRGLVEEVAYALLAFAKGDSVQKNLAWSSETTNRLGQAISSLFSLSRFLMPRANASHPNARITRRRIEDALSIQGLVRQARIIPREEMWSITGGQWDVRSDVHTRSKGSEELRGKVAQVDTHGKQITVWFDREASLKEIADEIARQLRVRAEALSVQERKEGWAARRIQILLNLEAMGENRDNFFQFFPDGQVPMPALGFLALSQGSETISHFAGTIALAAFLFLLPPLTRWIRRVLEHSSENARWNLMRSA